MIHWGLIRSLHLCVHYGNECIQSHSDVSRRHDIYSACHAKGELQSVSLRAEVRMARGINTILTQFSTLRLPSAWRVIKLWRLHAVLRVKYVSLKWEYPGKSFCFWVNDLSMEISLMNYWWTHSTYGLSNKRFKCNGPECECWIDVQVAFKNKSQWYYVISKILCGRPWTTPEIGNNWWFLIGRSV